MTFNQWLEKTRENRTTWNHNKKWWEPAIYDEHDSFYQGHSLDWLCDTMDECQDVMDHMWEEILRLRGEIK
jgi:hypothetical protein